MLIVIGLALAGCGGSSDSGNGNGNGEGGQGDEPEFTNARCVEINGAGHIANSDGDGCIDDPDYVSSTTKSATAKALLAALGRDGDIGTDGRMIAEHTSGAAPNDYSAPPINANKKSSTTVAPLNGWQGAHYEGEATQGTPAVKFTGEVRAYSNKGAAERQPFATTYPAAQNQAFYTVVATGSDAGTIVFASDKVSISGFTTTDGRQNFPAAITQSGSYDGASGTYGCGGGDTCFVSVENGKISALGSGWQFTPSSGATAPKASGAYLEFGWWVRKGKDGPVDAGTFSRALGGDANPVVDGSANTIVGSATYEGSAAGKFAISNSALPAQDNSGHFTADAMLKADFSKDELSGTIDNFTLNDTTKGTWAVSLEKATIGTTGVASGSDGSETKWSLDGTNFGDAGGDWEAAFYNVNKKGNSTTPNSVIGEFEASISSTHHLEGAFGAELE